MATNPKDTPTEFSEVGEEDPGAGHEVMDEPLTPDRALPHQPEERSEENKQPPVTVPSTYSPGAK